MSSKLFPFLPMMLGTFSVFLKKKRLAIKTVFVGFFFLNYKYSLVTFHFQEPLFSGYIWL